MRSWWAKVRRAWAVGGFDYFANWALNRLGPFLALFALVEQAVRESWANLRMAAGEYPRADYLASSRDRSHRDWKRWQSRVHLTTTHFFGRQAIRQFMIRVSREMDIGTEVLELGTGREFFNRRLFGTGRRFYTSDYPKQPEHDYEVDAQDIPFPDASFDCVICSEVLEHLDRPWQAITEIRRVLRPDGLLILTAPFWVEIHDVYWPDHWRFTPSGLLSLLEDDFEEIRIRTVHQYHVRRPIVSLVTARRPREGG